MALGDFFRINMPYGMERNDKDEWFVYNREYKPLGWNTSRYVDTKEYPVFTKYKGLTEAILLKLACPKEDTIKKDRNNEICQIWFYSDATNPKDNPEYWNDYFNRIKVLSMLESIENSY